MEALLNNWKTGAAGAIVILLGALELASVHIPGFSMDPGAAFAAGLGLLLAGDAKPKVPIRDVPKPELRH
jgi:hypothetical protein